MSNAGLVLEDRPLAVHGQPDAAEPIAGDDPGGTGPARRVRLRDALLPVSLLLWILSVGAVNTEAMNDFGLLPALPVTFFLALAVLVVSITISLFAERLSPVRLALHLVALIVILHATLPLIFSMPSYPWLYKHIGVADNIGLHGRLDTTIDIYHNWPGFFALAAWLTRIAGVDSPLSYAAWSPVYFNALTCLMLAFAYRWLPVGPRVHWLAAFLFVAGNWVGQDYFAPQAIAFVLSLAVFGMVLAWFRVDRPPALIRMLRRLVARAARVAACDLGEPECVPLSPKPSRPAALAALFGVFTVLVFTHQLSPYFVLLGVGLLTVAGMVRPRWVVVVLTAVTMGYLLLHFAYIDRTQDLFSSFGDPLNNVRDASDDSVPMAGRRLTAMAAPALILAVWTLAILGVVRRVFRRRSVLVLVILACAPVTLALGQAYGGEAVFRIYLFSLPWTAMLAAFAVDPAGAAARQWRAARAGVVLAGMLALFLSAFYGSMELYVIRPGEVQASRYFYDHAEPNSLLILGTANFPARLGARYDEFRLSGDSLPNLLTTVDDFRHRMLGVDDLPAISSFVLDVVPGGGRRYLALSTGQAVYAEVLGLLPKGSFGRLDAALSQSPDWSVFHRNVDAVIYRLELAAPEDPGSATTISAPPVEAPARPPARSRHEVGLVLGLLGAAVLAVALAHRARAMEADERVLHDKQGTKGIDMRTNRRPVEHERDTERQPAGSSNDAGAILERELAGAAPGVEPLGPALAEVPPELHRVPELVAGVQRVDRFRAVQLIARAWGPLSPEHLGPVLRDPASAVRVAAIQALDTSNRSTAMLDEMLRNDLAAEVRVAAIGALGSASEPAQLSALTTALADPDARVRASALENLLAAGAPAAASVVLAATQDAHRAVRCAAYRRLALMPSWVLWQVIDDCAEPDEIYSVLSDQPPERLERLALARAGSPNPAHRVVAVELAGRAGTPECMAWTMNALRDPAAAVRIAAARRLGGRSEAVVYLARILASDPEPTVRRHSALALQSAEGDDALLALVGALHDPDAAVRQVAVDALPAVSSAGLARRVVAELTAANTHSVGQVLLSMGAVGREALASVLTDGPDDRAAVAATLLRGGDALTLLTERLTSLDPAGRLRAVDGFGALGGPEAVDALISALSDVSPEVRLRAVYHLGRLADPRGARALEFQSESDPVGEVARAAQDAIHVLHSKAGDGVNATANGRAALVNTQDAHSASPGEGPTSLAW